MLASSGTTSVPPATLTSAGFSAPTESEILPGVQADINAAFGGALAQALTTPQGQLATSMTAIIGDANDQLIAVFNSFDPRNAFGRMQDAIGYLYFMTRNSGESTADFETRREATIEANSSGTPAAIMGALLNISDVNDAYVIDNPTDNAVTLGGVNVPARSLYISVSGGTPAEVGQAILAKKNPGSLTSGPESISVTDPNPVYDGNGPSYTFNYNIAIDTQIYIAVTIANSSIVPSTALNDIQNAIVAAFNGQDGNGKTRIGSIIFSSRFYSAVSSLGTWARILSIYVGSSANPTADYAQIPISERPVISSSNISLTLV